MIGPPAVKPNWTFSYGEAGVGSPADVPVPRPRRSVRAYANREPARRFVPDRVTVLTSAPAKSP